MISVSVSLLYISNDTAIITAWQYCHSHSRTWNHLSGNYIFGNSICWILFGQFHKTMGILHENMSKNSEAQLVERKESSCVQGIINVPIESAGLCVLWTVTNYIHVQHFEIFLLNTQKFVLLHRTNMPVYWHHFTSILDNFSGI